MARKPNSAFRFKSRYVQGGTTERYPNRLAWWNRRVLEYADDDVYIEVLPEEAGLPHKISYRVYNDKTGELAWLIMQYNNIVDELEELKTGVVLRLPSPARVMQAIMSQSTGGVMF